MISHNAFADQVMTTVYIKSGVGSEVSVNTITNKIYLSSIVIPSCFTPASNNKVFVIDGSTNAILNNVTVGYRPWGVTVNPNSNMIYVANTANSTISVIDGTNDNVVKTMQLPAVSEVGINPNTGKLYVTGGSDVYVVNSTTGSIMNTISVSSAYGVGVDPNTNRVYVSSWSGGTITVIDGSTDTALSTIPVGKQAGDVGVNPLTDKIYVPSYDAGMVYVIDGSTNAVVGTIAVGSGPSSITVNPTSNMIYAANTGSLSVSVINGTTNIVIQTLGIGHVLQGITVNPTTNRIYVADSSGGCPPQQSGFTVIQGGSFNTPTIPSAPQNLQVTAGDTQVLLSWSTPSSNGGSSITNYNIYRGTSSGSETLLVQMGNVTSYNDTAVTNSQTYFYKVTAVNSVGESAQSNEASATPTAPTTVPGAPTGLAATAASSSQINLSWTVPANNGGSAVTGYMIERSTDSGTTWSTIQSNTGSTATAYSDTGLTGSTAYTYRVSAINPVGTSVPSNTASATTNAMVQSGITLNNIQSTSGTASNTITISSFNAGTGSNNLLLVGISANNNDVASVTFGSTQLKNIAYSFYNNDAEFWYLKNPTGTGDVTVTMNGPTQAVVGAYAFSGVNETAPIPTHVTKHNTSANSPTISITTKYTNDWVLDLPSIYGGSTLGTPTCTQQWDANVPNGITGASSSTMVQTPGTVSCKWTASSPDLWDDVAVELKAG